MTTDRQPYDRGPRKASSTNEESAQLRRRIAEVGMRVATEDDSYPTIDLVLEADPGLKRGTVNKYSRELDPARSDWESRHGEFPHRRRRAGSWKTRYVEQENRILAMVGERIALQRQLARALEERDAAIEVARREKRERMRIEKVLSNLGQAGEAPAGRPVR